MKRISSKSTFFHKRVFPIIWFGFLGIFILIIGYTSLTNEKGPPLPVLIVPIGVAILGYFLFKKLLFDLVDEVHDCGDYLLVKLNNQEEKIDLKNIKNVSYSTFINPPRVTLLLRVPCRFGNEISFTPPKKFTLNIFFKSPVINELIDRIDAKR